MKKPWQPFQDAYENMKTGTKDLSQDAINISTAEEIRESLKANFEAENLFHALEVAAKQAENREWSLRKLWVKLKGGR